MIEIIYIDTDNNNIDTNCNDTVSQYLNVINVISIAKSYEEKDVMIIIDAGSEIDNVML